MKVINKILCFFSVLSLCVPLLCFNVSADEDPRDVEFNNILNCLPDFDSTDFSSYDLNSVESMLNSLFLSTDSSTVKSFRSDSYYLPFEFNNLLGTSKRCPETYFIYALYYAVSTGSISLDLPVYYFFHFFTYLDPNGLTFYCCNYVFSNSLFYFESYDDTHNSIHFSGNSIFMNNRIRYPLSVNSVVGYSASTKEQSKFFYSDTFTYCGLTSTSFSDYSNGYKTESIICNFNIDGLDLFDYDFNVLAGFSSLKSQTLSDQIDVKLTPDFGLDMDRLDPLTNQSDYFKFEITNNSDSAIQWCAGIYDPELVTADTMDILNLSSWAYVSRTTYYDFSVKEDKGIFRTTYTYSGALKTGSFDYHYLQPGETFSDLIFWENINIKPNVIYHFFVNAVKTDLNYSSLNIDPPVTEESSDMHSVTVIEDSYYNTILEGASSFKKLDCNIYNIEFSCLSMPSFTTTVRGGNSVLNTSGNDRYLLKKNYETVSDINGLDTKINKDFTDPSILANTFNRSDVSVDIDSFSVDDVKSYITSCQSFFILIKDALLSFPAFIWALICFGLTGLIVIAVVKALL